MQQKYILSVFSQIKVENTQETGFFYYFGLLGLLRFISHDLETAWVTVWTYRKMEYYLDINVLCHFCVLYSYKLFIMTFFIRTFIQRSNYFSNFITFLHSYIKYYRQGPWRRGGGGHGPYFLSQKRIFFNFHKFL